MHGILLCSYKRTGKAGRKRLASCPLLSQLFSAAKWIRICPFLSAFAKKGTPSLSAAGLEPRAAIWKRLWKRFCAVWKIRLEILYVCRKQVEKNESFSFLLWKIKWKMWKIQWPPPYACCILCGKPASYSHSAALTRAPYWAFALLR